jgi:hypothetical protein
MKKVIFTDIDGVFHDGNDPIFTWAEHLWKVISPYQVNLVIHSSWRLTQSVEEIRDQFPYFLKERVIALTEGSDPCESVLRFIENNFVDEFIVIDDNVCRFPSSWFADGRLILCETGTGLSSPSVLELIRKFLGDGQSISSRIVQ